jgi:CRP/FNR family transcriptional regulator, cyclic AMP receptor protein
MPDKITPSQRASDFFTKLFRSWNFVSSQAVFIAVWIILNTSKFSFDPYPFDLLKLVLLIEILFMGSIMLMNQNRQSGIDRKISFHDYAINYAAKKELEKMLPLVRDDHTLMAEALDILKKLPIDKR